MKICIFASIGDKNLGDELILKNEIQLLKKEFSSEKIHFRVATYDLDNLYYLEENMMFFDYFPNNIRKISKIFSNLFGFFLNIFMIATSDIVVIGGGGIFYDSERQNNSGPLKQWLFRVKIAKFFGKKIYFFAPSIDIKNEKNLEYIPKIFKNAYKITLRDEKSREVLKKFGIQSEKVHDPVWYDNGDFDNEKIPLLAKFNSRFLDELDKENFFQKLEKINFNGKKVGIAFREGYFCNDEKEEKEFLEKIFEIIEKKGGKIIFLPHSFHKDENINDFVFLKKFITENRNIEIKMEDVYKNYTEKKVDIILAQRLHSMILAGVYKREIIAFSYAQKTQEILDNYFYEL